MIRKFVAIVPVSTELLTEVSLDRIVAGAVRAPNGEPCRIIETYIITDPFHLLELRRSNPATSGNQPSDHIEFVFVVGEADDGHPNPDEG